MDLQLQGNKPHIPPASDLPSPSSPSSPFTPSKPSTPPNISKPVPLQVLFDIEAQTPLSRNPETNSTLQRNSLFKPPTENGGSNNKNQNTTNDEQYEQDDSNSDDDDDTYSLMGRRVATPSTNTPDADDNGLSSSSSSMAASLLEHRRKHAAIESPSASTATAHLIAQNSFSLDDPVTTAHGHSRSRSHGHGDFGSFSGGAGARGFSALPERDKRNFLMLVLLYFLQGLPMGLAMGSVPVLLKSHVSYTQMGVFSLASYPYSMKLLWSPIVDSVWSLRIGRRKSWILPIQTFSGLGMLWLAGQVQSLIDHAGDNQGSNVWGFTAWWFSLVLMCATQDIAVDGWALTCLSTENLSYASTAQTVGLTAGQFLTSTIFLAFNSPDFANRWFRSTPGDAGLVSLGGMLAFSGWAYLIVTAGLGFLKREELSKNEDSVLDTYKIMWGTLKIPAVQSLLIVHLIAKIGFIANDSATQLKLLDKGFGQDNIALAVLIDFPFEIGLGYYVGKWSSVYPPMHLWSWAFIARLFAAGFAQLIVMVYPSGGVTKFYLVLVILGHVFSTFMSTVMFVAVSAFHAKIADPIYGGTYMTLLATLSNLGGTFPKFFVLKAIDTLTSATCEPPVNPTKESSFTSPFSCVAEADRAKCLEAGGNCVIGRDGYYWVNVLCIIIGVIIFTTYIRRTVFGLQGLPLKAWRLGESR